MSDFNIHELRANVIAAAMDFEAASRRCDEVEDDSDDEEYQRLCNSYNGTKAALFFAVQALRLHGGEASEVCMINWRPHTELPETADGMPVSVLVAYPTDAEGPAVLAGGPYVYQNGEFLDEEYDEPPERTPFFWVLEREVVAYVPGEPA